MRHRSVQNRSLGIRGLDQLADHRLIVLLAALVEAQARPRSMRNQRRYDRRLMKWQQIPIEIRAAAIHKHSITSTEVKTWQKVSAWK